MEEENLDLVGKIAELENEILNLSDRIDELEEENLDLTGKITALENEILKLNNNIKELESELERIEWEKIVLVEVDNVIGHRT